jgi:thiosulfate reductase cytochrome b subunit
VRVFKNLLIVLMILSGLYVLADILFGIRNFFPDQVWTRILQTVFFLSVLIFLIFFTKTKNS